MAKLSEEKKVQVIDTLFKHVGEHIPQQEIIHAANIIAADATEENIQKAQEYLAQFQTVAGVPLPIALISGKNANDTRYAMAEIREIAGVKEK